MTFSLQHLSTILKYGGISFIAGAVNHGFFSEARSLWTALLGVVFYLIGAGIERREDAEEAKSWRDILGVGIVFSIGIGFFTGGLQHFPDSPDRSLWVVPLGFAMSCWALYMMEGSREADANVFAKKNAILYGVLTTCLVVGISGIAWRVFEGGHHAHAGDGHSHSHSTPAANQSIALSKDSPAAAREIIVDMGDNMRFTPGELVVIQGETIRFLVKNSGKLQHEWVIGNERELLEHAQEMKKSKAGSHKHDMPNALSLAGGEQGVLTWRFDKAESLAMACFEPGHYEAGMKGVIKVVPAINSKQ